MKATNFSVEGTSVVPASLLERDPERVVSARVKGDDNGLEDGECLLVELHEEAPLLLFQRPDGSLYFDRPKRWDRAIGVVIGKLDEKWCPKEEL